MKKLNRVRPILKIAQYTISDDARQKSFIVMFIMCGLIVFLFRGCFQGSYVVNGRMLESVIIVRAVSQLFFQLITAGTMFLTALVSMRVMKRDSEYGTQSYMLSKPISRWQYVLGKVSGLWVLSILFMLILHAILMITANMSLSAFLLQYIVGSLLCIFNLYFVIVTVLLLSLLIPDILAFLVTVAVGVVSFVIEGIHSFSHNQLMQTMVDQAGTNADRSGWRSVYYLWPKLAGAQHAASTLVGSESLKLDSVYPFLNVIVYGVLLSVILVWRFRKHEIT